MPTPPVVRRGAALALAGLLAACQPGAPRDVPQTGSGVVDLPIAGGGTQRVYYRIPEQPVAALLLLTGGDGLLTIDGDGHINRPGNFLIRTRESWVTRGFAVAIPDVPTDRSNLYGSRLSASYGEILRQMVADLHGRTSAPIWLVGTSQGTVAAAAGAARLTGGEIAGVVLTSSLTRPSRVSTETVFGAGLDRVTVPALILSHRGDRCAATPPSDADSIRAALTHAPATEIILVEGGSPPRSDACEAFSEHGYLGIEPQVVTRIGDWIKAH